MRRGNSDIVEERVRHVLAHTGGTMPVSILVADEAERTEVEAVLAAVRSKAKRLVTVRTEAEADGAWRRHVQATAKKPEPARPKMVRGN